MSDKNFTDDYLDTKYKGGVGTGLGGLPGTWGELVAKDEIDKARNNSGGGGGGGDGSFSSDGRGAGIGLSIVLVLVGVGIASDAVKAFKKHFGHNSQPTTAIHTNSTLVKNYDIVLNDGSTCTLPAGTKLNDKGAAKNLWNEERDLVTVPIITGDCKSKMSPQHEWAIPRDLINNDSGASKATKPKHNKQQSSTVFERPAYRLAAVTYSHSGLN